MQFDDTKTTSADELEYAAILFRTIFWLLAMISMGAAFVNWWWI